jgi:hypothetical protein
MYVCMYALYVYIDICSHNTCIYILLGRITHICIHDIHSCIYCRYKHHYSHSYYKTSIDMCVHIHIWKYVEGFRHCWNDDSKQSLDYEPSSGPPRAARDINSTLDTRCLIFCHDWLFHTYCSNMLRAYMLLCNNGWLNNMVC